MRYCGLLIKPASSRCNLRCKYCFYRDEAQKRETADHGIMRPETLRAVIKNTLSCVTEGCAIGFQGGEPLLAGLDFYKEYEACKREYNVNGVKIETAMQTNGLLLDDVWAEFFAQHDYLVGLSLDGPKASHERWRGKGSFERVSAAAKRLQKHGASFNVLSVVTSSLARDVKQVYEFYKAEGYDYLQFIPCLDPLYERPYGHAYSLTPELYGDFLCTLFDLWYQDFCAGRKVHVRYFENLLNLALGLPPESCGLAGVCALQNVVEADGSLYPCDFYVLDAYRLGNLSEQPLEEIAPNGMGFIREFVPSLTENCRACKWKPLCGGGCRRDWLMDEAGNYTKNRFCEAYMRFFEHAWVRLSGLARRLQFLNAGRREQ